MKIERSIFSVSSVIVFVVMSIANCAVAQKTTDQTKQESNKPKSALDFTLKSIDGVATPLKKYEGKVVLIVNTASKCGLTPQYQGLQELHESYSSKGLVILGFPCNQFLKQEPGNDSQIKEFCLQNYGVKFPMFSKIDVKGDKQVPLYKYLTSLSLQPAGTGKISWNFEKFMIGRDGKPIHRFSPRTKPDSPELLKALKEALGS